MSPLSRGTAVCAAATALFALASACSSSPVEWGATTSAAIGPDSGVVIDAGGSVHPDTMVALAATVAPPPGFVCPGSLRLAASGPILFGAWWAPRPDSSAALLVSQSIDRGRHWSAAARVDTTDHGVTGCRRAAPAVAADSVTGYVYVTYGMHAAEGPGLFFSHSMDGGVSFHTPVPILYGDRLGHTSVAADGDIVIVGFEDPNSATPRIGLAISRTMGHIFEERILPLSDDVGSASRPLTAVRDRQLAVGWEQRAVPGGPAALDVRTGTLR